MLTQVHKDELAKDSKASNMIPAEYNNIFIIALIALTLLLLVSLCILFFKKGRDVVKEPEHGPVKLAEISIPMPAPEAEVIPDAAESEEMQSKQPPIIVVNQPPSPTTIQPAYP